MFVPTYVNDGSTDPHNPPQLVRVLPRRKPPGGTVWVLTLEHDMDESFTPTSIPPTFARDRDDIVAAYAGTGPAYSRVIPHLREVEIAMHHRVNAVRETFLENASARIKSVRTTASKGAARVLVLLEVEAPVELAEAIVRALDSDVDVDVVVDGELPFEGTTAPTAAVANTETVRGGERAVDRKPEPRRRKRVEDLPPEPVATDLDGLDS